jgi:uncharacterized protein
VAAAVRHAILGFFMWFVFVTIGTLAALAHAVYFGWRLASAAREVAPGARRWLRTLRLVYLAVALSVPLVTLGRLITRFLGAEVGRPGGAVYDYLVAYPFWLLLVWSVQCSLFIVPIDLVHLGLRRLGVARDGVWQRRKAILILGIAGLFLVYVPLGLRAGARLEVRTHVYTSASVPPALDGYRIAHIADLQADRHTGPDQLRRYVAAVQGARPDLILIAGDLISRGPDYIELAARHAGELQAPDGVFSSVGDHDNFAYGDHERSVREVTEALARHGVQMLDNQVRTIDVDGAALAVILASNNYINELEPEITAALLAEARGADLQVLVTHQTSPALVAAARAGGVDLLLGGHTHGGQLRFWLPLVDLSAVRFETPYVSGAHPVGDMLVVVSNGLGVSVAPFRYRAPATVDLIELRRP